MTRKFGLTPPRSLFVTLLYGLSPVFLPVAVSYMTDGPALFFTFASFYFACRAAEAEKTYQSLLWLALSVLAGIVGGTNRQVVFLVPLVILPYFAWVRRHDKYLWRAAITEWVCVFAIMVSVTRWFNNQPYSVYEPPISQSLAHMLHNPLAVVNIACRFALMMLLYLAPAAIPLVWRSMAETWRGPRTRKILVGACFVILVSAIIIHPSLASIPWISSTLNWQGISGDAPLPGRPVVLVRPIRFVVAFAVYSMVCVLAGEILQLPKLLRRIWSTLRNPRVSEFPFAGMSLFALVYFALVIVRSVDFDIFDRYTLPILPWGAAILLEWFRVSSSPKVRARDLWGLSWGILVLFAAFAVANTRDLWALAQARVVAEKKLEASGIPRTAIDGGWEINAWTELITTAHIDNRRVKNPANAYHPELGFTPHVRPVYRLEYQPVPGQTVHTNFGSVPYCSLLPPFRKQVSIDRLLRPSASP